MNRPLSVFVVLALAAGLAPARSAAQPYARFAVPDSQLVATIAAGRLDFENQWNALFVAELRASQARADSAARLGALSKRVARAETQAIGSRIATDALAMRGHWTPAQRRVRVRAAVSESLATAARAAREFAAADEHYRSALADYRALGERRREAWVLGGMAASALISAQLARAESLDVEALAKRRALGDARLIGNTLNDLGQIYFQLGRLDEANAHLREAYQVRMNSGQRGSVWNTLTFLGLTFATLGKPDSAEHAFNEALAITVSQGDSARTFDVLGNLVALMIEHDDPRAIAVSERALVIARAREDLVRESTIHFLLAGYLRRSGRYSEAIERFRLTIRQREDDPTALVESLNSMAVTLVETGDPEAARPFASRAQAIADSLNNPSLRSAVLSTQASIARSLDDRGAADRFAALALEQAVAAGDSGRVRDAAEILGAIALEAHDIAAAARWRERALDAGRGLDPERHMGDVANLAAVRQLQGNLDEAERGMRATLELARGLNSTQGTVGALTNLGDIAERRGDFPAAFARYDEAIASIDSARGHQDERESITLFAREQYVLEAVIHLLGRLDAVDPDSGYARRAFELAERSRARSLLDRLDPRARSGHSTVSLAEARRLLGSDREALLEYSVGDSSTSLWVVRRDGWKHFMLPRRSALRPRIQAVRRGLADPAFTPALRAAQYDLYASLVAPAEPFLRGVDRLVVVPDGILALVPFEALLTRTTAGDPAPSDYLLHRFAISYTPSASTLAARAAVSGGRGIVALANPRFAAIDPPLAPLPSTADEAAALRGLAKGRAIETLLGDDATRERLLAVLPGAGIVHIATHGDANDAEPDRSGLWMAASSAGAPERLEARDVIGLHLNADLVTLSACETGLGRVERGEGVLGLARAFLAGGARSVVVSLWSVNDRSTAELMRRFYRAALTGKQPRVTALAEAKRALLAREETRSPYYWAPFVLIGEAGPLR